MPRHYHNPAASCPYYRGEDSARGVLILCAGVAGASTLRLNYANGPRCVAQKRRFCCADWEPCPVARLNLEEER